MCTWYKATASTKWQGDGSAVKAEVVLTVAPWYPKGWWRWPRSCKEMRLPGFQVAPHRSSGWLGRCCCIAAPAQRVQCCSAPSSPSSPASGRRWCAGTGSKRLSTEPKQGAARIACGAKFSVIHKPRPLCSSFSETTPPKWQPPVGYRVERLKTEA